MRSRELRAARPPGAARRFAVAAAALVVTLIGVPLLLAGCSVVALGTVNPLPGVGSGAEIKAYLDRGLTSTEIVPIAVRALLVVGWLLWLAMALSVIGAIVEARTGSSGHWPRVALFAGLSRWIAAGLTAFSALSANFVSAGDAPSRLPFTISALPVAGAAAPPVERAVPAGFARVRPGESAETFAERVLGEAGRWNELWELNHDQAVGPAGESWTLPWKLGAGWDLRLPAGATVDPPADGDTASSHEVQPGDSYWSIAEATLGDDVAASAVAGYTAELVELNAPTLGYADPVLIHPGDVVELPPVLDTGEPSAPVGDHVYVVAPGDSYWRIAERRALALHGPDGAYSTVVYELMLELIDLNAPRLGHHDRELIHPGDVVWLYDPGLSAPAPVDPPAVDVGSAEADGDGTGEPAAAEVPPSGTPPAPEEATATTEGPETTVAATTEPPLTSEPPPATSEPLGGGASGGGADDQRPSPAPLPIGIGEAALLATGVLALLGARRRARLRAAEPPARIPLRSAAAIATERALRHVSDADRLLRVDIGIRAAAATLAATASQIAVVRAAPDGAVELVLTTPAQLPPPWEASGERWTLPAEVTAEQLAEASRSVGLPCLALTEVGVDDQGWDVLVDLEAVGLLSIDADPAVGDDIVRALAAGLATSVFAEVAHLVGVGVAAESFLDHRHAQCAESVDDALELAATIVGPGGGTATTFALRARRTGGEVWEPAVLLVGASHAAELKPPLVAAARGRRGVAIAVAGAVDDARWVLRAARDGWVLDPAGIRLCPVGLTADESVELADVVSIEPVAAVDFAPPTSEVGVAAETAGDAADVGGVSLSVHHDLLTVLSEESPKVTMMDLAPLIVTPDEPSAVMADARCSVAFSVGSSGHGDGNGHGNGNGDRNGDGDGHEDGRSDDDEPRSSVALAGANAPAPSLTPPVPEWSVLVRLIGPVEVIDRAGAPAHFDRSKALELLAWLVTHRDGATRTAARTALWELDVRDATFANIVSEARRAMARHVAGPEGDEWLRRTMTDELSLHGGVVSDADVIRTTLVAAREVAPADALGILHPAVELVRGLPFSATTYLWPDAEGITSGLVLLATSVTSEYARHALSVGDTDGVFWSTGKGLAVIAGQETLVGLRMHAHARAGDLSGVRLEWEAYERVLHADPWSDGEPAPKLVALRQQLLAR